MHSRDVKFRTFYSSESLWSSRETKQTIGKIQLWYSRRIDSNSSSSASLSSPSSPSLPNLHAASDLRIPRRPLPGDALLAQPVPLSNGFLGPPLPTLSPYPRRTSHVSTASRISVPSSVTTTDTAATTFSNASIKTYLSSQTSGIVSSDGNIEAYKPEKPPEPMLVLLIRKDHHGRKKTSLLGVKRKFGLPTLLSLFGPFPRPALEVSRSKRLKQRLKQASANHTPVQSTPKQPSSKPAPARSKPTVSTLRSNAPPTPTWSRTACPRPPSPAPPLLLPPPPHPMPRRCRSGT